MRAAKLGKYYAIAAVTVRNHLVYLADFFVRGIFLLVILYIFIQLWKATFDSSSHTLIAGFTYPQMIWYLVLTESIIMGQPKLVPKIENEVKTGEIAYRLTKPVSYMLYHYASYLAEGLIQFGILLLLGSLLGSLYFGMPPFNWTSVIAFLALAWFSFTVSFIVYFSIGLLAFWLEEVRGIEFAFNKLVFTLGGMMLPLEVFPPWLQSICRVFPFQVMAYLPAKTALHFHVLNFLTGIAVSLFWVVTLGLFVVILFRKVVSKLHVNGG